MMGHDSDHVVDWKAHCWTSVGLQMSLRIPIVRSELPSGAEKQARLDVTAGRSIAVPPPYLGLSLALSLLDLSCLFSNLDGAHDNQMWICPPSEHLVLRLWTDHSDELPADGLSDPFQIRRPRISYQGILGQNTKSDRSESAVPTRCNPHSIGVPGLVPFDHRHDTVRVYLDSAHTVRHHHRI